MTPDQPHDQPSMRATASDQARVYQAGRDQTINQTVLPEAALRPVAEVAPPPGLVNVPSHGQVFVGRVEELADLQGALAGPGPVVVATVHGLGGVGKSTLAARYAAAHFEQSNPVWWITADSAASVESGLAGLAARLQPELRQALPLPTLAERALAWLAAHQGWLLVLDNVTDPADIAPLLSASVSGRVLVTSRLREGWHRVGAVVVRLDVLDEDSAVELFTQIAAAGRPGADPGGAVELVREVGYLPLAIEQAAAYLHQTHLTPRSYLELLAARPAVMFDRTARGADAERTIARIWRITLDHLTDTPLAGHLLRAMAWLAPEAIPRSLLTTMSDAADVHDALGNLAAYNMVTLDEQTVTVHRLVQAVARTADPADPHRQEGDLTAALGQATDLLDTALGGGVRDPATWPVWRVLLPHVEALIEHASPATDTATTARLLNQTGLFLHDQGAVGRAIAYHRRALTASVRVLGEDHPDTLTSRNNLAGAYETAGDLGRAIPLLEQTLADRVRVLGADHPATLISRNNLAYVYETAGDLERAIPLYEQTLTDRVRVLGEDHPDTLQSRNNLAYVYETAGDLEQTLADRVRVLGEDHPDTLQSRNNLASAYQTAGDLGRAIPLLEQTLADRVRVLGEDHPATLISRNNLAGVYEAAGDLERTVPLLEQTLTDCIRVLGGDHPITNLVRRNLEAVRR